MKKIVIELEREEDGRWIADIPSIPGAMAYGDTQLEAISKALTIRNLAVLEAIVNRT